MFTTQDNSQIRRIAAYIRVSTREQAEEGLSPDTQRTRIRQWVEAQNLHDIQVYEDLGLSGALGYDQKKTKHRPGLARLVEDVEAGRVDAVVVYRLDRIFRSPAVCVRFLDEVVLKHQVPLISVQEGLDSRQSYGRMMMQMLSVVSGYYLDWMSENISDNLQKRKEDGHPMGIAPFGWEYVRDEEGSPPRLSRVKEQGRWLLVMKNMFLSGHSIASITQELHRNGVRTPQGREHWNECVIRRLLQNPKQAGCLKTSAGKLIKSTHYTDRYWDLEDYHRIDALFEERVRMGGTTSGTPSYLLSGLLSCSHCGQRMYGSRHRDRISRRYRCCSNRGQRTPHCRANSKPADILERCVVSMLHEASASDEVQRLAARHAEELIDEQDGDLLRKRGELLTAIEKAGADISKWNTAFLDDPAMDREQFHQESTRLNDRKQRLLRRLAEVEQRLERRQSRVDRLKEVQGIIRDFDALWGRMGIEERRHAVHMVVREAFLEHHEDGSATLTVVPHFLKPREFAIPHLHSRVPVGDARLSLRELALLKLHHEGVSPEEMARQWGVKIETIHAKSGDICRRLETDLDGAAHIAADVIEKYGPALPVVGRVQRNEVTDDESVLTGTQKSVLRLVLEGHKALKIAETLGIGSVNTVYVHLHHARKSMGTHTDLAAAEKARHLGILGGCVDAGPPTMSPRELALLVHVRDRRTPEEVAELWGTSHANVRKVIAAVRGKLDEQDLLRAAEIVADQINVAMPDLPLQGQMRELPDHELRLTPFQREILTGVGEGLTRAQLAERVDRSANTVGYHLTRLRKVFGVHTSREAADAARCLGLL